MNPRVLAILLAVTFFAAGCATPVDPLVARRRAYERILKNIEPGMTRRQLYAHLPPKQTPQVTTYPEVCWGNGLRQSLHQENYPLDRDFSIEVLYRLANPLDYIYPQLFSRKNGMKIAVTSLTSSAEADALLRLEANQRRLPRKQARLKENLDDEIVISVLVGPGRATSTLRFLVPSSLLFVSKQYSGR